MKNITKMKKNYFPILSFFLYIYNIYNNISPNLRFLQNSDDEEAKKKSEIQKRQLKELFIYISVLAGLIILILVLYFLYKKYLERQAREELLRESQNLFNFHNSISAVSQEERQVYSFNVKVDNKYIGSEIESNNPQNNSFDFNHEERLEKIRRKYGNKMLIQILFKDQIEKVIYSKNMGEEYGDNCTICVNNFIDNMEIYRTPCEHIFHKDCLNKYLKKIHKKNKLTCPNCNQNLLVDKKFLKLRNENERLKIKINKKKDNLINNINNMDNIETDKKEILDIYNIATNSKNDKNDIKTNLNINKDRNEIFIVKKRKKPFLNQDEKHAATTDNKNRYFNIYNPNENLSKKNKNKEKEKEDNEDVLYIYDSEDNSEENKKENFKSLNEDNIDNKKNDIAVLNININKNKDKKRKSFKSQIKFAEMDNDNIYRNTHSKDINSNRGLMECKTTFNQIIDMSKK